MKRDTIELNEILKKLAVFGQNRPVPRQALAETARQRESRQCRSFWAGMWDGMTHVPAAAGRNSRSAACRSRKKSSGSAEKRPKNCCGPHLRSSRQSVKNNLEMPEMYDQGCKMHYMSRTWLGTLREKPISAPFRIYLLWLQHGPNRCR